MAWVPPSLAWNVGNRVEPTHTLALLQQVSFDLIAALHWTRNPPGLIAVVKGPCPIYVRKALTYPCGRGMEWQAIGWLKDAGTRWNSRLPGWARLTRPS